MLGNSGSDNPGICALSGPGTSLAKRKCGKGGSSNRFHRWIAGLTLVDAAPEHRAHPARFGHGVTREIGPPASTVKETSW